MATYAETIVRTLTGETERLRSTDRDRLDWEGVSELLALYDGAGGEQRVAFIEAMGEIIEDRDQPAPVVAQVVSLAANLDLAQLEPSVRVLHHRLVHGARPQSDDMVEEAVVNFLAYRELGRRLSALGVGAEVGGVASSAPAAS